MYCWLDYLSYPTAKICPNSFKQSAGPAAELEKYLLWENKH